MIVIPGISALGFDVIAFTVISSVEAINLEY